MHPGRYLQIHKEGRHLSIGMKETARPTTPDPHEPPSHPLAITQLKRFVRIRIAMITQGLVNYVFFPLLFHEKIYQLCSPFASSLSRVQPDACTETLTQGETFMTSSLQRHTLELTSVALLKCININIICSQIF